MKYINFEGINPTVDTAMFDTVKIGQWFSINGFIGVKTKEEEYFDLTNNELQTLCGYFLVAPLRNVTLNYEYHYK